MICHKNYSIVPYPCLESSMHIFIFCMIVAIHRRFNGAPVFLNPSSYTYVFFKLEALDTACHDWRLVVLNRSNPPPPDFAYWEKNPQLLTTKSSGEIASIYRILWIWSLGGVTDDCSVNSLVFLKFQGCTSRWYSQQPLACNSWTTSPSSLNQ
jgi:hypothetical protein